MKSLFRLLLLGAALLAAPGVSRAEFVVGLTTTNQLFNFDSATPGVVSPLRTVTGLGANTLVGIDFRPATGQLYGLGVTGPATARTGTVFLIDNVSGAATTVFSGITLGNATAFGVDFNPVPDALRIVSNATNVGPNPADIGNNYRLAGFPTGVLVLNKDGNLNPTPNNIVGAGYTNAVAGATTTTLYDIDATADRLRIQNPPNNGVLVDAGALGINTNNDVGFDISGRTGVAFASLNTGANFGTINLTSGAYSNIGRVGPAGLLVADISVASVPEPSSLTLLGLGGLCLAGYLRRRRRRV